MLQGSEEMWGAASHALIAVAQDKGWAYGSHRALFEVAERLAEEMEDPIISLGFGIAEKLHANFYHGFMEDYQRERSKEVVRDFVRRVLGEGHNGRG